MKNVINTLLAGTAVIVGMKAGEWLWDEVLEDKVTDFKDYLANKHKEKRA